MATTNNPKVRFHRVSSLPSTGVEGHIYFVTGQDLLYTYNSSGWDVYGDKVTAVGKHYTPAEDTSKKLSADASSTTAATWGSTSLVTGVDIKRDAAGHVVGVAVDSIKMPANPNTDTHYTNTFSIQGSGTNAAVFSQSANQTLNLVGGGATTVTASSGKITISSTDTKVTSVGNHYEPSGGTAKSASGGTATSVTVASGSAIQVVSGVVCDAAGHVTGIQSKGLYAADTKNTAGSTDTSSKIFLIGATTQAANPQTYSQDTTFINTDASLHSTSFNVAEHADIKWNAAAGCLEIITT